MPTTRTDRRFGSMCVRAIDAEKRTVTAYASTGDMDRHGTVIEPTAFTKTMPEFMKNPVVLNCHQHWLESGEPSVIGKVVEWEIDDVGLLVTIQFADTRVADEFWQLYLKQFMRGFSVGFRVKAREQRPREDGSGDFEVYTDVELLEISAVAVPSNREALVTRGVLTSDDEDIVKGETLRWISEGARSLALDAARELNERMNEIRDSLHKEIQRLVARVSQMEMDHERWRRDAEHLQETVNSVDSRLKTCERDIDEHLAGPSRTRETEHEHAEPDRIDGLGF